MNNNRTLAVLSHIFGLLAGFLGPLIILLVTQDDYVKKHAKLSLNWQFSFILYYIISFILMFVLIGIVGLIIFAILDIVFPIIAAVNASENKLWKYPLAIPFFKVKV